MSGRPSACVCRWEASATCPRIVAIQEATAARAGVTRDEMLGRPRPEPLVFLRNVSMLLARRRLGCSYPTIGAAFAREHKGAYMGIRRAAEQLAVSPLALAFSVDVEHALDGAA